MGDLYENIRLICEQNGTTVTQMCKDLDITRSILSELKSGRTKTLSLDVAQKIASFFFIDVDFLSSNFASDTCPECGFNFLKTYREDILEHERIHEKRKKAIKKYGFLWNHAYRERVKQIAISKLNKNELSVEDCVELHEIVLKALFSRSLQSYDYDLDHISFSEYCAAMIQQNDYSNKIPQNVLENLNEKYGKNNFIPNGTCYNPSQKDLKNRISNILSRNLFVLRKDYGVSKAFIADVIGIKLSEYSAIELSQKDPENFILVKLANYFGVTIDFLLGMEESKNPADNISEKSSDEAHESMDPKTAEFIRIWNNFTDEEKDAVISFMRAFKKTPPSENDGV